MIFFNITLSNLYLLKSTSIIESKVTEEFSYSVYFLDLEKLNEKDIDYPQLLDYVLY